MNKKLISKCCGAEVRPFFFHGKEYFDCMKCGGECDTIPQPIQKEEEVKEKQLPITVNGKTFGVDETIYDLVKLLNENYKPTVASCSGHGFQPISIIFNDDTEMRIMTYEQAREVDKLFPDINGDRTPTPSDTFIDETMKKFDKKYDFSENETLEYDNLLTIRDFLKSSLQSQRQSILEEIEKIEKEIDQEFQDINGTEYTNGFEDGITKIKQLLK